VFKKIIDILSDYRRVLNVAKKPTLEELKDVIRICGIGIAFIGFIGFVFFLVFALISV